jgi:copper oxidase (laccase) domain-containing protein
MSEEHFEKKKKENSTIDQSWDKYVSHKNDEVYIDLLGYVMNELKENGILKSNITVENIDTGSDPNYFSHRRHKLTGEPDGRNTFGVHLL